MAKRAVKKRKSTQREADEKLLKKSSRAAQKTAFPISQTENVIREFRKRRKQA